MKRIRHALLVALALTMMVHVVTGLALDERQLWTYAVSLFLGVFIYLSIIDRRRRRRRRHKR